MDLHELNHYIIFFEFYEKLMNESTQTIWFSFDYNSHDMLNKLDKFCRNNSRLEIIGCEYFFLSDLTREQKLVLLSKKFN